MTFSFFLIKIIIAHFLNNSGDPDQTPRFVASDLGLHCLSMPWQQKGRLRKSHSRSYISSFPCFDKLQLKMSKGEDVCFM